MNFIDFNEEHLVRVPSIDVEHKTMAEKVNTIHDLILKMDRSTTINEIKIFLEILESHFENEERLMKENQFPGYFSHKLEHDRFYRQILTAIESFRDGKEPFGLEQLKGIRRWFFNHIEINDRKCGQYLSDKGIL